MGQTPAPPGVEEYKRAMEAWAIDGDRSRIDQYLKRGGKVFKAETVYPDAAVQRGGSNASRRRSANLPTDATSRSGMKKIIGIQEEIITEKNKTITMQSEIIALLEAIMGKAAKKTIAPVLQMVKK
jgi:hypothetical protein